MIIDLKLDIGTLKIDKELKERLQYIVKDTINDLVKKKIQKDPTVLRYVEEISQNLVGGLTLEKR